MATRRRGDLSKLIERITTEVGTAKDIHSDARNEQAVIDLVRSVENEIGPTTACVFNVGGNVRFSPAHGQ